MNKKELRTRLKGIEPDITLSHLIVDTIAHLSEWQQAQKVAVFMPMAQEIQITLLIETAITQNKSVFIPWITPETNDISLTAVSDLKNDLVESHYGILEPKDELKKTTFEPVLDIILVPGLGFDLKGNRIGHGRGYYDRLLAKTKGLRCGVCFESHIVEQVPIDAFDQSMDLIITEKRVIRITQWEQY